MEVELPQYYMALVLADTSQGAPNSDHLEASRLATIDYLERHLKPDYPSLQSLELEFVHLHYLSERPLPRFHVYWEVNAVAKFLYEEEDDENSPNSEELYESVGEAFDADYREFLLKTVKGEKSDSSPLESAKEVQVRRTKLPTAGGGVKAPPFYMGIITSEDPTRKPNAKEIENATTHTYDAAVIELKKKFPEGFRNLHLNIKRTAINEDAGQPSPEFKLYVEFEAVGEFSENTPEPMDFFRVISLINQPQFILDMDNIGKEKDKCPFFEAESIAMNVCAWYENGEEEPEEEMPDEPPDGEMTPSDEPPVLIDVHLEFWVALVIPKLEELPPREQSEKFDDLVKEFVEEEILQKQYKDKFHDWTVEPEPPQFEAGLPLLRFNMLHGYQATIQFQDPPPRPADVLERIVKCNVAFLIKRLQETPSEDGPWDQTQEATFGTAFNKDPNDKVYGGKIDRKVPKKPKFKGKPKKKEEPKPRFKGKPKKKLEEERLAKEKAEEEERRKREAEEEAERQRQLEEEEQRRREEEEAERQRQEEERKRKEEERRRRKAEEAERKRQDDLRKLKELEEKRKREEEEAERKRQEEEARRKAAEEEARRKKAAEEEAARKKAEEEARIAKEKAEAEAKAKAAKKKKAKEAKKKEQPKVKVPPTKAKRPPPPGKATHTSDVYVALDVWYQKESPTEKEYEAMCEQTRNHYDKHLKKIWGDIYNGIELEIDDKAYGSAKPNKNYNVYVLWKINAYFEEGKEPSRYDLMVSLVRDMDVMEYLQHLRKLDSTCWANACGILHQQTVDHKDGREK